MTRFRASTILALTLALTLPLTSCGLARDLSDSPEADPSQETLVETVDEEERSTDPEPGEAEDALPYFEALAQNGDADAMEAGLTFAHPDQPAHGYLRLQADTSRANHVSGYAMRDNPVELRDDTVRFCTDGCTTFGDFVFVDGLLADFRVNGNLVSDYFHPGGGGDDGQGVSATVTGSYYSANADALIIIVDVETDEAEVDLIDALYESSDGSLGYLDPLYGIAGQESFTPTSPGKLLLQLETHESEGTAEMFFQCAQGCSGEVRLTLPIG